jgi:hypothetical protein
VERAQLIGLNKISKRYHEIPPSQPNFSASASLAGPDLLSFTLGFTNIFHHLSLNISLGDNDAVILAQEPDRWTVYHGNRDISIS